MVLIDGEKWACQSCIKGHRVSGCQHHDRELQHINPKGRPVKQCDHCRNSRKTKSHHARCDCGHKKDKASKSGDEHSNGCACHTGSKCLCGSKKDHGLKIETSNKAKPRLTATQSESTLTVFANGHHKPCHRLNNAAHTSGMPYKIPRPHTLHGPPAHHSSDNVHDFYNMPSQQRSLDNIGGLPEANGIANINNRPRSGESLPLTPFGGAADTEDFAFDPFKQLFGPPMPTSVLGSGSNSPVDGSLPAQGQWSWTAPVIPTTQYGYDGLSTSPTGDFVPTEHDWAIPSAGLQPSWSAVDLPLHPDKLNNSVVPISHSGESAHASVPGLSTSSSQSEIGEPHFFGDMDMRSGQHITEPIWEDAMQYRKPRAYRGLSNASTPPEIRTAPTSVPTPESQNRSSLDLDFLRRTSPPSVTESDVSFMPQPFSNPIMEAVIEEKISTPSSDPYMVSADMDDQPRSMALSSAFDDSAMAADPWMSFPSFPPNPFDTTEVPAYAFNDNFS